MDNLKNIEAETVIETKSLVFGTTKDEKLRVGTQNFYIGIIIKKLVNAVLNTFWITNTIKGV